MSLPSYCLIPAGWPPSFQLRLAAAADELPLHAALYADRPLDAFSQHFQHSLKQQTRDRSFWPVVSEPAAIVAAVQLLRGNEVLEIANLAVHPTWRNQGIGTGLIALARGVAAHFEHPTLEINVASDNQRALALYRGLGFTQRRVVFVPDGTWAVRLTRPVAAAFPENESKE